MAPPIKCWNVFPTFRIWSVFTALTSKMWKKGSGPVLGLILRVSAFSLEEASYHVRNLATWNYHAMRKPMFVSHVAISLCRELRNSVVSVQRPLTFESSQAVQTSTEPFWTFWGDSRDEPYPLGPVQIPEPKNYKQTKCLFQSTNHLSSLVHSKRQHKHQEQQRYFYRFKETVFVFLND